MQAVPVIDCYGRLGWSFYVDGHLIPDEIFHKQNEYVEQELNALRRSFFNWFSVEESCGLANNSAQEASFVPEQSGLRG